MADSAAGPGGEARRGIPHDAARRGHWLLVYEGFDPEQEPLREALCTTGNGYFATRGAAPEARAGEVHYPGTYAAGIFNRLSTEIAGRTVWNESIVNLPNWLPLSFRIDGGPWFELSGVELLDYEQELDLRQGVLHRRLRFRDGEGRLTRLTQRRFVSMADRHLAGLETTIHSEDWSGRLEIRSGLDGEVENSGVPRYRDLAGLNLEPPDLEEIDADTIALRTLTNQSRIEVALAARTSARVDGEPLAGERRNTVEGGRVWHEVAVDVARGASVTVEKVVSLYTARDPAITDPATETRRALERAAGFEKLLEAHVIRMDDLWQRLELRLEDGGEGTRLIVNLHIFHLLQTLSNNTVDLDVGVPARGLHGEAYRGHIFWDEMFVFPLLTLNLPELTRSLLRYRYRRLPEARRAAADAGYAGAMFPWQSGSDGREESQQLHLNPRSQRWLPDHSHRQRHINIAIAYNVWLYHEATGDIGFVSFYGAEMFLEIARFWASIATFDHSRDRYVINGVMGPDEYHDGYPWADEPGLDNNAYTNLMAVWVLCRALDLLVVLPLQRRRALWDALGLTQPEVDRWRDISRRMFVPFHDDGVISQFEGYERLEELDWDGLRERHGNIERLDRILEAEGRSPNEFKASKQADVLMLFMLLSTEEIEELFERLGYRYDPEIIPRTIDYYIRRTSDGSTLSRVVHSWVLARSDRVRSWELFTEALASDFADIQGGTTAEGIHLGAMAGTVDLIARGYSGVNPREDVLWLAPCLPDELDRLSFSIRYRRHWGIRIEIADGRLRLRVPPSDAPPITVGFGGELTTVAAGESFEAELQ